MTARTNQARPYVLLSLAALLATGCVVEVESAARTDGDGEWGGGDPSLVTPGTEENDGVVGTPIAVEPAVLSDEGDLCLYPNEAPPVPGISVPTAIAEEDRLVFQVTHPTCLSSSCTMDRRASCRITQVGRRLFVEASFAYVPVKGPTCTKDCLRLTATCQSEPLAAGIYDVVYLDDVVPFAVPSRFETCGDVP